MSHPEDIMAFDRVFSWLGLCVDFLLNMSNPDILKYHFINLPEREGDHTMIRW